MMTTKRPTTRTSSNGDTDLTGSVVSYPDRCNRWGDPSYRGNCDGQLFRSLVLQYRPKCIADPMMGSGTTRDVVAELNERKDAGIRYWGGDLKNGFNLVKQDLPGSFDFVWIHPPYWSIIQYSDHPDDLSNQYEYEHFHRTLTTCLRRCHDALQPGGRLAVLVGDVRRFGVYTPIVRDVLNLEGTIGRLRSIIIKQQHHCRSDRKVYGRMDDVPIRHEYCVVFQRESYKALPAFSRFNN